MIMNIITIYSAVINPCIAQCNAGSRTRTGTSFTSRDFKSLASANFAMPAKKNDSEGTRTLDLRRDRAAY